ncbi:MAG: response regulator transcription factor [Opitutae bacterium]|nr:response regulator transcription factor [Opitutae bacterium]
MTQAFENLSSALPPPAVTPGVLFRALLVDPDPLAQRALADQLPFHADFELATTCGTFTDAAALLSALAPELVIIDWETIADPARWHALPLRPRALIVTAGDPRHAAAAFELEAVDFLLKPIAPARFALAMARARVQLRAARLSSVAPASAGRLVLKRDGEFHFVSPHDIVRVEAQGDYVKVHTRAGVHLVRATLTQFSTQLDPQLFLRVHRSHVINRDHVTKATLRPEGDYSLTLGASGTVPVARAQTSVIRRLLS